MKPRYPSFWRSLIWFLMAIVSLGLLACAEMASEPKPGFEGLGQGRVTNLAATLHGEIQFKAHLGGDIILEARHSFPCNYGRCPVIEVPPLGTERVSGPGPFAMGLAKIDENLIIIATYISPSGGIRVAHQLVEKVQPETTGIFLSLDRPYPPLR